MEESDRAIAQSHIDLEERVRQRAYEIYQSKRHGHDGNTALDDWLQAEREVLGEGGQPAQDRGTTVGSAYTPDRFERLGEV